MIRYLKNSEIDKMAWDKCIYSSPNSKIYAYSWYLDHVCPNWRALILDDYLCVMPLTVKKKYLIHYLYQPFFCQQLGLYSHHLITQQTIDLFISSIPKNINYIDISIAQQVTPHTRTENVTSRTNYELNIQSITDNIINVYNSNHRRNIAKENNKHPQINLNEIGISEVVELFKCSNKAAKKIKPSYFQQLTSLSHFLKQKKLIDIISVQYQNKLAGAAVFIKYQDRVIFIFSGRSNSIEDNHSLFIILDYAIKKYSKSFSTLDFEGSDDENLARFYSGFGAISKRYYRYQNNRLSPILKIFKK